MPSLGRNGLPRGEGRNGEGEDDGNDDEGNDDEGNDDEGNDDEGNDDEGNDDEGNDDDHTPRKRRKSYWKSLSMRKEANERETRNPYNTPKKGLKETSSLRLPLVLAVAHFSSPSGIQSPHVPIQIVLQNIPQPKNPC